MLIESMKTYLPLTVLILSTEQLGEYTAVGGSVRDEDDGYMYILGIGEESPTEDVYIHELVHVCQHFISHSMGFHNPRRLKYLFSSTKGSEEGMELLAELECCTLFDQKDLKKHIDKNYAKEKRLIELEAYWLQEMYLEKPDEVIELLNLVLEYV
jgi:hypothetical protein